MRVYRENSYCGKPSAINPSQFYQKFCNMPRPKMGNRSWQFRRLVVQPVQPVPLNEHCKGHCTWFPAGPRSHQVSPGLTRGVLLLGSPANCEGSILGLVDQLMSRWLWDCDFIRSSPLISAAKQLKISCKSTYGTLHSRPTFLGEFYDVKNPGCHLAAETEFPAEGWCQKHWTIHLTYKSAFGKNMKKCCSHGRCVICASTSRSSQQTSGQVITVTALFSTVELASWGDSSSSVTLASLATCLTLDKLWSKFHLSKMSRANKVQMFNHGSLDATHVEE